MATRPGSAGSAGSDPAWTSAVAACDWVEAWQLLRRMEELQLEVFLGKFWMFIDQVLENLRLISDVLMDDFMDDLDSLGILMDD